MKQPVWLLRHAESEWNAAGRWQGRADPPLSERGIAQAARAAIRVSDMLAGERIATLYCSTLERAITTARAVGAGLGLEPVPVPELQELDVGRWTGLSTEEIRVRDPELLRTFETGDLDVRPGGGETRRELRLRAVGAISERAPDEPHAGILCVVHLGVVRALVPGAEPSHVELASTTFEAVRALAASDRRERGGARL